MTVRLLVGAALGAGLLGLFVLRGARLGDTEAQATVIDSVVPRELALARFREGTPRADTLAYAGRSRDALIRRFAEAVRASDTAAITRMTMTRAEYAWLYYPTTPQGLPPYDLAPELLWFLIEGRGAQGLSHLMESRAGIGFHFAGARCDSTVAAEGPNRIHGPCVVRRVQAPGDTVAERLFGQIIERDGRFKFVSLGNKL